MLEVLSSGFPESICFFQPLSPASPSACLAVCLPGIVPGEGRGYHVPHSWSHGWLRCALLRRGHHSSVQAVRRPATWPHAANTGKRPETC